MQPLVSVIIPTFNRARLIGEAINSALSQSYRNIEVIVVDDGSTDETAKVVAEYGQRVLYIQQPNQGSASARNTGVRAAKGNLLALLDSDDRWLPHKLELQIPLLLQNPSLGMVYGGFRCFSGKTGAITHEHFAGQNLGFHDLLGFVALGTQTLVFRREAFDRINGFDVRCILAQDQDFTIRLALHYPIAGLNATVAEIRMHDDQISANTDRLYHASMFVLRKNEHAHENCEACRHAAAKARKKINGFHYRDLNRRARLAASAGKLITAATLAAQALWADPTAIARMPVRLLGLIED